jgi:hypothetical protein
MGGGVEDKLFNNSHNKNMLGNLLILLQRYKNIAQINNNEIQIQELK